ncbi:sulfatase (plasmid) [Pedobacter sp. BS3]|uniref:sulfatase family protein n=1 Tax=Pedobacter sp. BS3 TaxID=2567937 RepID=UPI0011EBC830|nr:sulfatase [Pedobacter sp. BS3]TZF85676.1 sulfatase [Pedobacter sp. BS3]
MKVLCWNVLFLLLSIKIYAQQADKRPNILFCIADDASFQHMSAYGLCKWIQTPGFDRVAKNGLLFTRAYTPNAKCSPSRAAILTGRNSWQLEDAGNHNSFFPAKFTTFMEALGKNGYTVGFTGKGWGPGNPGKVDGKPRLLTGQPYNTLKITTPTSAISAVDYAGNFETFMNNRPKDKPFCFWYGSHEPHRKYEYGSGVAKGQKKLSDIDAVPPIWIDNEQVRNDMLDYGYEVEYFDKQLQKILTILEKSGQLDNTIVVVTSDNGMPFPRTKGHLYEYDNHLPLAIMWKRQISNPGRKITDFVSFIDFAPTFLDIARVKPADTGMQPITGKSLLTILTSKSGEKIEAQRDHVLLGREREDIGRPHDQGYPVRAILKGNFIYACNYEPDRWPCGNPETGYMDTDSSPTKTALLDANRAGQYHNLWMLSFGKRPAEELYQVDKDPWSVKNLAYDSAYTSIKNKLKAQMEQELKAQNDPRMFGKGYVFDNYPYANKMRNFYDRFISGEQIKIGFDKADFEPAGFEKAQK